MVAWNISLLHNSKPKKDLVAWMNEIVMDEIVMADVQFTRIKDC